MVTWSNKYMVFYLWIVSYKNKIEYYAKTFGAFSSFQFILKNHQISIKLSTYILMQNIIFFEEEESNWNQIKIPSPEFW